MCLFCLSWYTCGFYTRCHAAGGPSGVPLLADSGWLLYSWRELWPQVTPWTWPIREGIEPWKSQIGFSCLMSKLPHHAPGVSVARSLALLALSKPDLWSQLGERSTASWQTPAQQSLRAGLPQRECSLYLPHLWSLALRIVPHRSCPLSIRVGGRGPPSRHSASWTL